MRNAPLSAGKRHEQTCLISPSHAAENRGKDSEMGRKGKRGGVSVLHGRFLGPALQPLYLSRILYKVDKKAIMFYSIEAKNSQGMLTV